MSFCSRLCQRRRQTDFVTMKTFGRRVFCTYCVTLLGSESPPQKSQHRNGTQHVLRTHTCTHTQSFAQTWHREHLKYSLPSCTPPPPPPFHTHPQRPWLSASRSLSIHNTTSTINVLHTVTTSEHILPATLSERKMRKTQWRSREWWRQEERVQRRRIGIECLILCRRVCFRIVCLCTQYMLRMCDFGWLCKL